jgi:NAD(P)H-hydrate epimerase
MDQSDFPELAASTIPFLTTAQMIEVDRLMTDVYRIDLVRMMENAGRNLAHLARVRFFNGDPRNKRVVALAGSGGNGGGVLVAARRLHNFGAHISVVSARPATQYTPVPSQQLEILQHIGIDIFNAEEIDRVPMPHLILDGLIGYSLKGSPRGATADLIRWANDRAVPILALDIPSGLDATTGTAFEPTIKATTTMTLALPKQGLQAAAVHVGELYLADISVPPQLYRELAPPLEIAPIFSQNEIIRLIF